AQNQVVEERVSGAAKAQYVWSPVYVGALIYRDRDTDGNGTLEERLWVEQDANWNVTALVDILGNVVERYEYDPYGSVTVLAPDWTTRSSSNYDWRYLWQGQRFDPTSGLYATLTRDVSPTLGRPLEADPLGLGPDVNPYRWEGDSPGDMVDP